MNSPPSYAWATDFQYYITSMTRGQGYDGEQYWDEEEQFLRTYFANKVGRSLSVGCGLFRELDTLKTITHDEIWGMDSMDEFIRHIKPLEISSSPIVRVENADLFTATIHPKERFDLVLVLFNTFAFMHDMSLALNKLFDALLPGGTLLLSFWNDDIHTVNERCRIYTSSENKTSRIEYNAAKNLSDIVISKDGDDIFRSTIFTKKFLQQLAQETLPDVRIAFHDLTISRIMLIHKDAA